MKRWMAGLLFSVLFLVIGCTGGKEVTTGEENVILDASEAAVIFPEEATVGIYIPDENAAGTEEYLKKLQDKMTEEGFLPENIVILKKTTEEWDLLEEIKKQEMDLLLTGPWTKESMVIVESCREEGISVIGFLEQDSGEKTDACVEETTALMIQYLNGEISDDYQVLQ